MKVLIVDDEKTFRQVALRLFNTIAKNLTISLEIIAVDDYDSALKFVQENLQKTGPEGLLIYMDKEMPGHDGIETAIAIRKLEESYGCFGQSIIFACSTVVNADNFQEFQGANTFVAKPCKRHDIQQLIESVRNINEREILRQKMVPIENLKQNTIYTEIKEALSDQTRESSSLTSVPITPNSSRQPRRSNSLPLTSTPITPKGSRQPRRSNSFNIERAVTELATKQTTAAFAFFSLKNIGPGPSTPDMPETDKENTSPLHLAWPC